jgi:hypothetical protein
MKKIFRLKEMTKLDMIFYNVHAHYKLFSIDFIIFNGNDKRFCITIKKQFITIVDLSDLYYLLVEQNSHTMEITDKFYGIVIYDGILDEKLKNTISGNVIFCEIPYDKQKLRMKKQSQIKLLWEKNKIEKTYYLNTDMNNLNGTDDEIDEENTALQKIKNSDTQIINGVFNFAFLTSICRK